MIVGKPPFEVENEQYTMKLIMNSNNITFPPQHSTDWVDFVSQVSQANPPRVCALAEGVPDLVDRIALPTPPGAVPRSLRRP
jgi:hypothetical protein